MVSTMMEKKILLVDDDEDFSFILKKKFEDAGFKFFLAKDGEQGALETEKIKPDLILSDVLMPKMDGVAMVKKIRSFDKNVIIILLTNTEKIDGINPKDKVDYLLKSDTRIDEIVEKVKEKLGI